MPDKRSLEDKTFTQLYLYVCAKSCVCMSLYIFQQHRPRCSISVGLFAWFVFIFSFLLNLMPLRKNPRDFVWVIVHLFLYKICGERLKEQNISLLYYTAMPSGCRSGTGVLLLSNQLHILETPAPTQKLAPAVTPWNSGEHIHCKTRCPPRHLPCFSQNFPASPAELGEHSTGTHRSRFVTTEVQAKARVL